MMLPYRHSACNKKCKGCTCADYDDASLCPSYRYVIVPSDCDPDIVRSSAANRAKSRFPAIVYIHENGSFLARSAQPLMGSGKKHDDDVHLVKYF